MPDDVVGLDPDQAGRLSRWYERLGRDLDDAAASAATEAAPLALGAVAAASSTGAGSWRGAPRRWPPRSPSGQRRWRRPTAWRQGCASIRTSSSTRCASSSPTGARATAWFDGLPAQPHLDPLRYALLGAWRALLEQGVADGHLVVMGDRVNGVTGAHLVPTMAVAPDGSVAVGYALSTSRSTRRSTGPTRANSCSTPPPPPRPHCAG